MFSSDGKKLNVSRNAIGEIYGPKSSIKLDRILSIFFVGPLDFPDEKEL